MDFLNRPTKAGPLWLVILLLVLFTAWMVWQNPR
jgi:hypothetical protein